jgi:hypothetical protein
MLSSKGVTPYKYGAKNIYIAKICKKRKKTCSKNGKFTPNMEHLTMEQKNFH